MRILITEEALETGGGHWPHYLQDIASGMREMGDEVDILAHQNTPPNTLENLHAKPLLSMNCRTDPRSRGILGFFRHNVRYWRETRNHINNSSPYDWILQLSSRKHHLLGIYLLSRSRSLHENARILALFVQGIAGPSTNSAPVSFSQHFSRWLSHLMFALLRPQVNRGRIVLAAETRSMKEQLEIFSRCSVALFPHPVRFSKSMEPALAESENIGSLKQDEPCTVFCPGFARHEKGSDLLQDAIIRLISTQEAKNFRFVLQWPEPFRMPDGSNLGPSKQLLDDENIVFHNEPLDQETYLGVMMEADFVILPYRSSSYQNRVSRVAIEAASHGVPLIFTSSTWIREVAELAGVGIEITQETPEAIVSSLLRAHSECRNLKQKAREGAQNVASYYSVQKFREILNHLPLLQGTA